MINIIFIINPYELFRDRMDKNIFRRTMAISKLVNCSLLIPRRDFYIHEDINSILSRYFKPNCQNIVVMQFRAIDADFNCVSNLDKCPIPKVWLDEDFFMHVNKHSFLIEKFNINAICCRYKNDINLYNNKLCYSFYINHAIDKNLRHDIKVNKDIDLLFYGSASRRNFPFRHRIYELLKNYKDPDLNIAVINHPGYIKNTHKHNDNNIIIDDKLTYAINKSWMTFLDGGKMSNMFLKYIEVPACASVMCGTMPEEAPNTFKKNYIHLDPSWNNLKIINTIKEALSNKKKLQKMIKHNYEEVHNNFTLNNFAIKLNSKLTELFDDKG
ncbi:MAG: hypothetical protein ACOC56_06460 [Atribacterota bacterium]